MHTSFKDFFLRVFFQKLCKHSPEFILSFPLLDCISNWLESFLNRDHSLGLFLEFVWFIYFLYFFQCRTCADFCKEFICEFSQLLYPINRCLFCLIQILSLRLIRNYFSDRILIQVSCSFFSVSRNKRNRVSLGYHLEYDLDLKWF